MIQHIVDWLLWLVREVGYPGVALAMFIESFFAPIPSEAIMPLAGWLAAEWAMKIWVLALVGGIASYLGTLPFYFLGYWGNRQKINRRVWKYGKWFFIKPEEIDTAFDWFQKWGRWFVFLGRLVPIVRTVISFPAGAVKMKFVPFSLLTLVGSTLWSALLAIAGYYLWANWEQVGAFVGKYEHVVLAIVVVCIVAYIVYLFRNRKQKKA